jgi:mono/diheme cytochrome c family protein
MNLSPTKRNWLAILSGTIPALFVIAVLSAAPSGSSPTDEGELLYKSKCSICHAVDGSANTGMGKMYKISDLRSAEVQKQSDAQLTEIVTNGKTDGNRKMMPFKEKLTPAQIQEVVAYLRELARRH